jgi:hypothetical protein
MPTLRQLQSYERWTTDQPDTEQARTTDLTPGRLVIWGKAPFRVLSRDDVNPGNWPSEYDEAWAAAGRPEWTTWAQRPMRLRVQRDTDSTDPERSGIVPADGSWVTLPEHYSVCRSCGELPPCREVFTDRVLAVESHRIDFEMRLTHGMCHGCGKPVTPREHSTMFPGDNLVRPDLGDNTAVFHTRRSCLHIALAYQDRWIEAGPDRQPRITPDGATWRA